MSSSLDKSSLTPCPVSPTPLSCLVESSVGERTQAVVSQDHGGPCEKSSRKELTTASDKGEEERGSLV